MDPQIKTLSEMKLIGRKMKMSFANNKTRELWQAFMPRRKEIKNTVAKDLYSLEIYDPNFFINFDPNREFEKWAAIEVDDYNSIPADMDPILLPEGLYAVFLHRGPASKGATVYDFIFRTWLPDSNFILDIRPHFALMGEKYNYEDENSEEEIWIPVKPKNGKK